MLEKRSARAAFALAGVAAVAAVATWMIGMVEARHIAAACNDQYTLFAEVAACRTPALYGAISWLLFSGAIASAWVGGVRLSRNAPKAAAQPRRAPPPHDGQLT